MKSAVNLLVIKFFFSYLFHYYDCLMLVDLKQKRTVRNEKKKK